MEVLMDILVIIGMFLLRLGLPLALVLALGYGLRRLDARWEAEARRQRPEVTPEPLPAAWPVGMPAVWATGPASAVDVFGLPCWQLRGCDPARREQCPAYRQPDGPCWLARAEAEGALPAACATCLIFTATATNAMAVSGTGLPASAGLH
ncbi:MAG: hypothetical protein N2383_08040 [Caldilineales bacterium]|nr:hypothetical protein [Caldilineales bacterium]